jgi:gas vesicle protein
MKKTFNMLLGLVVGGLVGVAVGLLLAPSSGRQLRHDFENYSDQLRSEVKSAAGLRRQEMEEHLARLRGEILSE